MKSFKRLKQKQKNILELLKCRFNVYSLCPKVRYNIFQITFRCNAIEKALIICEKMGKKNIRKQKRQNKN